MVKAASYVLTLPLLLKVSFLLLARSEEETHSMLSSVVASRSLSSDSASLFVAAYRTQIKVQKAPEVWPEKAQQKRKDVFMENMAVFLKICCIFFVLWMWRTAGVLCGC